MKPVRLVHMAKTPLGARLLGHTPGHARSVGALCLLASLSSFAVVAWQTWETRQQIGALREMQAASHTRAGDRSSAPARRTVPNVQQRRSWNLIARRLNTPWPEILDALESATPETVAMVSIEPDPPRGSVRLQAEAKTLDTLLGYAHSLSSAAPIQKVLLVKHETNEQAPTRPVRLSLDALLAPPDGPMPSHLQPGGAE